MKYIRQISIIFILSIMLGCSEEKLSEFSDMRWYTSESTRSGTPFVEDEDLNLDINTGELISFIDVSNGAISHGWTIESGLLFLNPEFTTQDEDFTPFIKPGGALASPDSDIHVLFPEAGTYTVKLLNKFASSVLPYKGISPVEVNGEWVFEAVFTVTVTD